MEKFFYTGEKTWNMMFKSCFLICDMQEMFITFILLLLISSVKKNQQGIPFFIELNTMSEINVILSCIAFRFHQHVAMKCNRSSKLYSCDSNRRKRERSFFYGFAAQSL